MPTDNHDYNLPAEGTSDWHLPLNENFSSIDSDMLIQDTESNLENYTPESGKAALATDSGKIFVGDGSRFNLVGYLSPVKITVSDTQPSNPEPGEIWIKRT